MSSAAILAITGHQPNESFNLSIHPDNIMHPLLIPKQESALIVFDVAVVSTSKQDAGSVALSHQERVL